MVPASKGWLGSAITGVIGIKSGWLRSMSELRVNTELETEME